MKRIRDNEAEALSEDKTEWGKRLRRLTFETERLLLRPIRAGDEDFLARLDSDGEVMQYIHSGALRPDEALEWAYLQVQAAPFRPSLHKWTLELRHSGEKAGWVELSKFRGVFDRTEKWRGDDIALGYQLAQAHWNRGVMTEAATVILAYAFEQLEMHRVVAFARPENRRSIRVLEKLGFEAHPNCWHRDEGGNNCALFALEAARWRPGLEH